jgi:hypothetical protein
MIAVVAIIDVISTHNISAIVASLTTPIIQRHIWTVRVVGSQDASDHRKKVREPSLLKGSSYCDTTITFAEFITTNMRVSYLFICCCRIRLKSDYTVGICRV